MRVSVRPEQLVDAVAGFLRESLLPGLDPTRAYELRVGINALMLASRAMRQQDAADRREREGLATLLPGMEGDLDTLNAALCDEIASGRMPLSNPALIKHLWTRSLDRLAIDQPTYSANR